MSGATRPAIPRETEALAAELAAALAAGDVVLVEGELGAGKTTFVRGACRALGVDGVVTSPTFTIGQRYQAARARLAPRPVPGRRTSATRIRTCWPTTSGPTGSRSSSGPESATATIAGLSRVAARVRDRARRRRSARVTIEAP